MCCLPLLSWGIYLVVSCWLGSHSQSLAGYNTVGHAVCQCTFSPSYWRLTDKWIRGVNKRSILRWWASLCLWWSSPGLVRRLSPEIPKFVWPGVHLPSVISPPPRLFPLHTLIYIHSQHTRVTLKDFEAHMGRQAVYSLSLWYQAWRAYIRATQSPGELSFSSVFTEC